MTSDDHYLVETQAILSFLAGAALSSNYLVNILPILKHVPDWLPGAGWKRDSNNEGAPVMVASLRADALEIGLTEDEADDYVSQIAITMFSGGTDTTVNTLIMFFMAMVLYPDVQKRAQAEIDSMLGHSRLPKVEDRPRLKYVDRVVQETLRWGPVTPIDDIYKSYRIPKGAIVMGNVWAMTCDKNVYKDPEVFEPDRYLDPATPFSPVFGWGRRRCPGIHLGQSSLFITIASILMTFDIGTIIDSDGKEVLPGGKMINAIVLTPERFEFELTPRSAKHEELIRGGL
ncbi:cytochrome P450 family protein [Rhizoctonia solani]|uniref:Cytochrome P450 family protein n=1 Tax=Rhizoctonia solani TaxID=456999 RepID=A0A8H8NQN1_9AGAM|nr:cytochrome P450 family protein [Rhizoctonia solani]QRW16686.1 cytochrome P450 family protein [Rhizoctonia solani]